MTEDAPKKRKPRKPKPGLTELRLLAGATILKTQSPDAVHGAFWTFADTGKAARADIVERFIASGKLKPLGDGLFPEDSQTWALA